MNQRIVFFVLCFLSAATAAAQPLTFEKDIAPIIHNNCTPCHRPNESGPFPLITYEDVSKRATFIKEVVETRYMPPWKANNHYVHYANDRSLSDEEIGKIVKWVNDKSPRGKPVRAMKATTTSVVEGTSYHRKPDLVLKTPESYTLPGDNTERFIVYKIPFELADSANVEAVEFFCDNKKIIHHANFAVHEVHADVDVHAGPAYINLTEEDRTKYDAYLPFKESITYYGGWIPGTSFESYPDKIGWVMPKRGVILLTVHYTFSAKDEESISGVNLFFTKTPVERKVKVISFGSGGIGESEIDPPLLLPPHSVKTFTLDIRNPQEDFSLMYVWPHMHMLGRSFLAYGISPAGDTIKLTHVPDWDFRWQEIYKFPKLLRMPKGTTLHIQGTYDNTIANPFNPNSPPQFVFSTGDMRTKDEMMTLVLVYLPYREGDENISLSD